VSEEAHDGDGPHRLHPISEVDRHEDHYAAGPPFVLEQSSEASRRMNRQAFKFLGAPDSVATHTAAYP